MAHFNDGSRVQGYSGGDNNVACHLKSRQGYRRVAGGFNQRLR
jgi:hypothetical protein